MNKKSPACREIFCVGGVLKSLVLYDDHAYIFFLTLLAAVDCLHSALDEGVNLGVGVDVLGRCNTSTELDF